MRLLVGALVLTVAALPARAAPILDGSKDGSYGAARAVQTVNTQFGDNLSELDAAYAQIDQGVLYLMLTGQVENNFNKLNIFIDSVPGGQNVLQPDANSGGNNPEDNDWANHHAGMTFDAGFEADFLIILRNGVFVGPEFNVEYAVVGGGLGAFELEYDVFGGSITGANANALPGVGIGVAYDNSNIAGVSGGTGPANQAAAAAVTTGIELAIPLSKLGNPNPQDIKVSAMVNGIYHDYLSNQFLGGLAPPQDNLVGDGHGTFTGSLAGINLNDFAGNQYFSVVPEPTAFVMACIALLGVLGCASRRLRFVAAWVAICFMAATTAQAQFLTLYNVPPDTDPHFIGSYTQLNVFDGGVLANGFVAGSSFGTGSNVQVNIFGGSVGALFDANSGSEVNISGGTVGGLFDAKAGSVVNISGGTVATTFSPLIAYDGSTVNISGGTVGSVVAQDAASLSISGGRVGRLSGSAKISGGAIGQIVFADPQDLSGGEFRLNGQLIAGLDQAGDSVQVILPSTPFAFSGILADGTPICLADSASSSLRENYIFDFVFGTTLTLHATTLPPVGPSEIHLPADPVPLGIRANQTLFVADGASVPQLTAAPGSHVIVSGGGMGRAEVVGGEVEISGGSMGLLGAVEGSHVNISAGDVGGVYALNETTVNVSGGSVGNTGDDMLIDTGSRLNFSGGYIDWLVVRGVATICGNENEATLGGMYVEQNGVANISGNTLLYSFVDAVSGGQINIMGGHSNSDTYIGAESGGVLNVGGGLLDGPFYVTADSSVQLFGTSFLLDGLPIDGLNSPGDTLVLAARDGAVLTASLADGSPLDIVLNTDPDAPFNDYIDYIDSAATLRLIVVPEPSRFVLLAIALLVLINIRRRKPDMITIC